MKTFDTTCAVCGVPVRARDKGRGQTVFFCSHACRDAHRRTGVTRPCAVCGTPTYRKTSQAKARVYCAPACANRDASENTRAAIPRGAARKNWKGGVVMRDGYRFLRMPEHPNANAHGYVAEHRLVMATRLGRPVAPNELVHHLDHNRLNNAPENLVLVRRAAHSRAHRLQKVEGLSGWDIRPAGCAECGTKVRRHAGLGLCTRCYARMKGRERIAARLAAGLTARGQPRQR